MKKRQKHLNYSSSPRDLIVQREPKSPVSEQYRTIRTNITYSSIDHDIKSILITSASPSAGKSTTAANVAIAFAQAGQKTLLLDADLRRPTMQYTFEVPNRRGLSTAIINETVTDGIIKETDIENLELITSGPIPPNPSELLASNKMSQLLEMLKREYDIIIIDSPPILAVTDAQLLSKLADATIMVSNVAMNNRDTLTHAKEQLVKADANIIGVVLNNIDAKSSKDSYYYYYGSE